MAVGIIAFGCTRQVKSAQSIQLPASFPEGEYILCVAILDPETNEPGIDLAIKGNREDNRYLRLARG